MGAMVLMPIWVTRGTLSTQTALRVWEEGGDDGSYHVWYTHPVSGKPTANSSISKEEYRRLQKKVPGGWPTYAEQQAMLAGNFAKPAATVTVRTLPVGRWAYFDVINVGTTGWRRVWAVWGAGAFWNVITLPFVYLAYVQPERKKRLFRDGQATLGRIVSKETSKSDDGTRYSLKYAFDPSSSGSRRASSTGNETTAEQDVDLREWEDALEGDEVWVLHWPGRAKPSTLYGYGPYVVG
jgi:hypothetical protein